MKVQGIELPKGILKGDLKYPPYKQHIYDMDFELWYSERFGWCIPTLLIGRGRGGRPDRTYATTLAGAPVRIGNGPHIKAQVQVYVRKSRKRALKWFHDLHVQGAETSADIRDRISTRRMRSAMRWNY